MYTFRVAQINIYTTTHTHMHGHICIDFLLHRCSARHVGFHCLALFGCAASRFRLFTSRSRMRAQETLGTDASRTTLCRLSIFLPLAIMSFACCDPGPTKPQKHQAAVRVFVTSITRYSFCISFVLLFFFFSLPASFLFFILFFLSQSVRAALNTNRGRV